MNNYDSSKYFLGKLCSHNHDWERTGTSLRYNRNQACVVCARLTQKKYVSNPQNHQKVLERVRRWAKNNPDRAKANFRKHKKTPKGRLSALNYKAKKRALNKDSFQKLTLQDIAFLQSTFDNRCCYCGSQYRVNLDHFVPLSTGGANTINNIVLCCHFCNSSKHNFDGVDWYLKQPFFSQERLEKIMFHLNKDK